ncbi:unnamed protein product [Trichogramma brassicae]|uniref:Uncharacterized protein n=1 Tax=Trichogramma brassicae TaxID=86971 RepID=A0A6H5J640_9HYME|nr:unnamed protein product [Trichogramma brassicae]
MSCITELPPTPTATSDSPPPRGIFQRWSCSGSGASRASSTTTIDSERGGRHSRTPKSLQNFPIMEMFLTFIDRFREICKQSSQARSRSILFMLTAHDYKAEDLCKRASIETIFGSVQRVTPYVMSKMPSVNYFLRGALVMYDSASCSYAAALDLKGPSILASHSSLSSNNNNNSSSNNNNNNGTAPSANNNNNNNAAVHHNNVIVTSGSSACSSSSSAAASAAAAVKQEQNWPYRGLNCTGSTFQQLKQSVEKAKQALADRGGYLAGAFSPPPRVNSSAVSPTTSISGKQFFYFLLLYQGSFSQYVYRILTSYDVERSTSSLAANLSDMVEARYELHIAEMRFRKVLRLASYIFDYTGLDQIQNIIN